MNLLVWMTLICFLLYVWLILSTILVIMLENRQPVKTIAWILVIITMPIFGLVFFYFFGQEFRREHRFMKLLKKLDSPNVMAYLYSQRQKKKPLTFAPLIFLFENLNKEYLFDCNKVDIYDNGKDFITNLLLDIKNAKKFIHIETYIIKDDRVGNEIADALIKKRREGVEVRFLYDDVGTWNVKNKFFERMQVEGIETNSFLPVRFPQFTRKINHRNHRKIVVIDTNVGYIGGMNYANRYIDGFDGKVWRDLQIRVSGKAVMGLQNLFLRDWNFVAQQSLSDIRFYKQSTINHNENIKIQIVSSDPISTWPQIMFCYDWMILNARQYIYLQTPYFMPTQTLLHALQTAALTGVDVRIMVPKKPDGFWLRWANDSYFKDVLEAGVRVFSYTEGFIHSKMAVSDNEWCTIGSANLDFRSMESNFEGNALIFDESTSIKVRDIFLRDMKSCHEINLDEWRKRPHPRRWLESFTRILSPLF